MISLIVARAPSGPPEDRKGPGPVPEKENFGGTGPVGASGELANMTAGWIDPAERGGRGR